LINQKLAIIVPSLAVGDEMPKIGQVPVRKAALVNATIFEIGQAGSLDVTVGQIAKRAGMSTALAHYYFESKDAIFLAAMRHLLSEFATLVQRRTAQSASPFGKLNAIIEASLAKEQFHDDVVAAWLVFYVQAQRSPDAARLLRVYANRLHSNLMYNLEQLLPRTQAQEIAHGMAAMIDGFYIRHALQSGVPSRQAATTMIKNYLEISVSKYGINSKAKH
jgi:TetR/AcrR family transcriptional repressor of bet genes